MHAERKTIGALLGIYAQTSMHPGAGTALGTVDLPVQRERHTHWPLIAGTALKGILRDACRERLRGEHGGDRRKTDEEDRRLLALFGPPTAQGDKHAGALSITDARLFAFPVRSLQGVFALVTCPAVLERMKRDAALAGVEVGWEIHRPASDQAIVPDSCPNLLDGRHLILEEFEFERGEGSSTEQALWAAEHLMPEGEAYGPAREKLRRSLVVLHDDDYTHFVRHATEVNARIALDYETKTVQGKALFYQEFLPPETLFYSVVLANPARARQANRMNAQEILESLEQNTPSILQIGGDETTGKGISAVRFCAAGGGESR